MISPELLRRYPFFGFVEEARLKDLAMITEEENYASGQTILNEGEQALALYFLVEGGVDLIYTVIGNYHAELQKDFAVGEINPGEPFGISSLIEPNILTSSARASQDCRILRIDAAGIKEMFEQDKGFAYGIMSKIAKTAIERLHATRIQLAAAWA